MFPRTMHGMHTILAILYAWIQYLYQMFGKFTNEGEGVREGGRMHAVLDQCHNAENNTVGTEL